MAASADAAEIQSALASAPAPADPPRRWGWAAADRFLGPKARDFDTDERRRARLVVAISASLVPLGAIVAVNLLIHGVWGQIPLTVGLPVGAMGVAVLLRRTGSLSLAGHALAGLLAATLLSLKLNTGAVTVAPFIFLPALPMIAALIAGPRAGLIWGGVALAELGLVYLLVSQGLEPRIEMNPEHVFRGRYIGGAVMVGFVLLLVASYERLKTRALDELRDARGLAEERSRELETSRREQLEMKDRFLSHVSHELRTPLAALHQFLSIVLDGLAGKVEAEQREYLEMAFRNAEQLRFMIGDLMDLNRARSGKLRVEPGLLEIDALLMETVRNLEARANEKQIDLHWLSRADLPRVEADAKRVRQVVSNLVENAIKFTPEGGRIEVFAGFDPEDDSFLRISVRDTGCGIDPAAVERVFERLHQERENEVESRLGLGIGLAIAKELVERQRGRIWAESEPGRGSTFHFTLPIFSLARSLQPCLFADGELGTHFTVLRIETCKQGDVYIDRRILQLLRSTVFYPDRDVLLPQGFLGDEAGRFTLLAATDADGAKALAKRLAIRLEHSERERKTRDVEFRIHVHTEEVPEELRERPQEETLEILADRVEEILREGRNQGEQR